MIIIFLPCFDHGIGRWCKVSTLWDHPVRWHHLPGSFSHSRTKHFEPLNLGCTCLKVRGDMKDSLELHPKSPSLVCEFTRISGSFEVWSCFRFWGSKCIAVSGWIFVRPAGRILHAAWSTKAGETEPLVRAYHCWISQGKPTILWTYFMGCMT